MFSIYCIFWREVDRRLTKLFLYLRNILDHAVMKKVILANPARKPGYRLKAKSRKAVSERYLSMEECQRLLSAVVARII